MMHSNKMVCCLKAKGKVLREQNTKDETQVFLPFGVEYSVALKNLNSVRASVKVSIDGTDVVGGSLIIAPNSEIELERFITNGNLSKGNRFKFVERTSGIEKHRGSKVDDGLVRIEFQYERKQPTLSWNNQPLQWQGGYNNSILRGMVYDSNNVHDGATYSATYGATSASATPMNCANTISPTSVGITAPGSVSNQQFHQADWFATENETHVMVFHLLGETDTGKKVIQPVTVKTVPVCSMCGKRNRATTKFCSECGTSLEIV